MVRKILQPFYTAYVLCIFLATLFVVLPFYLVLSVPNNKKCRKIMWVVSRIWATVWLWLVGMPVRKYGAAPYNGRYVVVANHVSYLDPIVIFNTIPWYFRPLAKKELKKVPIFGFIYGQMALLVDRSSTYSRAKSMRLMWRAIKHECSIFIYPEGTFNETEEMMAAFYDGAFRLAINTGVPVLPIIFPDTKERWHYSAWWKLWPGKNRAYILEPISVKGLTQSDLSLLKEKTRAIMSEKMSAVTAVI
jgi:1-acyl-sn-glycerol-3-phosphate acyltransferase